MKTTVILCLLALFCTVDATLLLKLRIKHAKKNVGSTLRQLRNLRNDVVQEMDLTITKKWWEFLEKHRNHVNPILDVIREDVETARMKGKEAQPCYNAALDIIRNVDFIMYNNGDQCKLAAKASMERNLCFIDELILTGQRLITELDNIFPKCTNNISGIFDIFKARRCIIDQLGICNMSVKNLQRDASSGRYSAQVAYNVVNSQISDCLDNIYSSGRVQVAEATSTATKCLNEL